VTVAALVSLNRTDQLGSHLRRALDNGLSKDGLVHANHPPCVLRGLALRDDRDHPAQEDHRGVTRLPSPPVGTR
jgi:hypothetical protein